MMPASSAGAFRIQGADGSAVFVASGEYYINTKPRIRRMMRCGLSKEAHRIDACIESHTMGYRSETAMIGNRFLTPRDIARETGLACAHVRRGLRELESAGRAERRPVSGGELTKGNVKIVSRALPPVAPEGDEPPKEAVARPQSATWGSDALKAAFRRMKIRVVGSLDELGPSRGLNSGELDEMEAIAQRMAEDEKRLRALAESVRAQPETAPAIRKKETIRKKERTNGHRSLPEQVRPSVFPSLEKETPEPETPPIRDKLRTFLVSVAEHFRLGTAPDALILDELAAIVQTDEDFGLFAAQVEKQKNTRVKSWKWFPTLARGARDSRAELRAAQALGEAPKPARSPASLPSDPSVCVVCGGAGTFQTDYGPQECVCVERKPALSESARERCAAIGRAFP
jgi:hypothetical protein